MNDQPTDRLRWHVERLTHRVGRVVFGDRAGLTLFLAAIVFYSLSWQVKFTINDNYAIANTLVAVADGHLYVDAVVFGPESGATPGMHVVDGRLYGRNFGQVLLSLPFLWALDGLSYVVAPRIAIVGAWSLLLLALFDQTGAVTDRRAAFAAVGVVASVALFAVNVYHAWPLAAFHFPYMALQLSSMTAAAFVPVLLYRLLAGIHDRRTAAFAGAAVALASPVALWATIPKRHSFTAVFVVAATYTLYRSRAAQTEHDALAFRVLSYTWVGLAAWVHGPEGVILLVSLGFVDVLTAGSYDLRRLVVVGVALCLAMIPVLVTNVVVSGDPLAVPRSLPAFEGSGTTGFAGDSVVQSEQAPAPEDPFASVTSGAIGILVAFSQRMLAGVRNLLHPDELYRTFVLWESPLGSRQPPNIPGSDLAVLQSMPLIGILLAVPIEAFRRGLGTESEGRPRASPARVADYFALTYLLVMFLIFLPSLPVHTTLTVRYLHPLYPLAIYFVARLRIVRTVLDERPTLLVGTYAGSVLVGGQALVVVVLTVPMAMAEPILFHGLVAAGSGLLLGGWAVLAALDRASPRTGAILIGLAAAIPTLYVLLLRFMYFNVVPYLVLPISRVLAGPLEIPT